MISLHLFTRKYYNEKKRKPVLQLKILNEFTKHDSLSKSKAKNALKKHHYGEISEAFDSLYHNELKLIDLKSQDTTKRGNPEKFYSITDNGLASIISNETNPENFWLSVIRLIHNRSNPIDLQTVNDLFKIFMSKYLKYASRESFLYLDRLNAIYSDWLQEKIITDSSIITQVLEILIDYPNITAEEIISRLVGASISVPELNGILEDFTMTPKTYQNILTMTMPQTHKERLLIHHNIIIREQDKSGKIFRLSLLGILLFLTILLHRTFNKSESLMYYYDRIAANYSGNKNKILPLIFGKWSLLKNSLGYDSLYNFDVILSKDHRTYLTSKSGIINHIADGYGCKELYQYVCSIVKHNSIGLKELYEYGLWVMERYTNNKLEHVFVDEKSNSKKNILPLVLKLWELSDLLNYMDINTHQKYLESLKWAGQPEFSISPIERICKALTEEITITYYLNLVSETNHANERKLQPLQESFDTEPTTKWASGKLATLFMGILKEDKEIRRWFNDWKSDMLDFHENVKNIIVEEPKRTSQHRFFSPYSDED